jgi:hypothetical protein
MREMLLAGLAGLLGVGIVTQLRGVPDPPMVAAESRAVIQPLHAERAKMREELELRLLELPAETRQVLQAERALMAAAACDPRSFWHGEHRGQITFEELRKDIEGRLPPAVVEFLLIYMKEVEDPTRSWESRTAGEWLRDHDLRPREEDLKHERRWLNQRFDAYIELVERMRQKHDDFVQSVAAVVPSAPEGASCTERRELLVSAFGRFGP